LSDHAVLIPTSEGPVGGIVSEPTGEQRGALIILAGWGRPARSGVNSFWTRLARRLAALGVLTLRFDYSREGETLPIGIGGSGQVWKREIDLRLIKQAQRWLGERTGDIPLFLAGVCSGARLAIDLVGDRPDDFAGTFLIVPHLRRPAVLAAREQDEETVDPDIVRALTASLARAPTWILQGEDDTEDLPRLRNMLPATARDLEIEIAPGALHFLDQPDIQEQAERRLVARVERALSEVEASSGSPASAGREAEPA
jgi:dienelactone hydrolase